MKTWLVLLGPNDRIKVEADHMKWNGKPEDLVFYDESGEETFRFNWTKVMGYGSPAALVGQNKQ